MQLTLQKLLPIPLRDRLQSRSSDIWMKELEWGSGAHIFVRAPSGTGKTTLIHMLYGLRDDYEGNVLWGNSRIENAAQKAGLRTGNVSVIFQDLRLFPELTAWENLEIKRSLTNSVSTEEAESWMSCLGIADKKNALGKTLSYGEQQRVAIIRALLQPFNWLLMDEPFSHLDHANTEKAAALIQEVVVKQGASFLLTDLDENNYFPYNQIFQL